MTADADALYVSPSQFETFDRCERSWWLSSVARVKEDSLRGQYLIAGDLFDEACQRYQAQMRWDVADLVDTVRAYGRGSFDDSTWRELAERAQRQLRAATRFLPPPKTAQIQHRYRVAAGAGVYIVGKADFRRPGAVWDTKTTADRGLGRGRDAKTPPRALTPVTIFHAVQPRIYAWCEFKLDPALAACDVSWIYASKPARGVTPIAWAVNAEFSRSDTVAWFDAYALPRLARMRQLRESTTAVLTDIRIDQRIARANHDGCARCFRRRSCWSFEGAQAHEGGNMVDIKKMRAEQAARASRGERPGPIVSAMETELETQLRASLAAEAPAVASAAAEDPRVDVPINRPDAPANPNMVESEHEVPKEPAPARAKRGRGRPRKNTAGGAAAKVVEAGVQEADSPATKERLRGEIEAGDADGAIRLERIATALQAVADAADSAVSAVNAELRALGARL